MKNKKEKKKELIKYSVRLDPSQSEKIEDMAKTLEENGVKISINSIFQFLIQHLEVDATIKKMIKYKNNAETIYSKAKEEALKYWSF